MVEVESKNRYLLGFLALLVEMGIFTKIKVSFLMVGHTHEDIDQVFSRFSKWLMRKAVYTLDMLMTTFEKCIKGKSIHSVETSHVWNISEWMEPHLIKMPHVFRITKEGGKAILMWKKWTTDKEWKHCDGSHHLLHSLPEGQPEPVQPSYAKIDFEQLQHDVKKSFRFMPKTFTRWWTFFFENKENETEQDVQWPIPQLLEKATQSYTSGESDMSDSISGISDDDNDIQPVVLGKVSTDGQKSAVKVGTFVATEMARYVGEWPQIGYVKSMTDPNQFYIEWYQGSITTEWKPLTIKRNRTNVPVVDTIKESVIIFRNFNLTNSGRLPEKVKQFLRDYDY